MAQTAVIAIAATQPTSTSAHVSCPLTPPSSASTNYDSSYNGLALPLEPLTNKGKHRIAAVFAWDSGFHVSAEEILGIEEIQGVAWINLTNYRTMPITASMLSSIRLCAGSCPGNYLAVSRCQIRIESDNKRHPVYTVWSGQDFLGSFHQSLVDGKWLTNPMRHRDYCRHETQKEAVAAITTANSLRPYRRH